ncbi:hypothetical protein PAMC26510_29755 [Caballeronia sordidicola]|uniref:Uncharacterized protein n=1 Tax=Caballeronia sordidicola TaxID=196367 RepID=A0A242M9M7_CABSO|nr:hypothetical protein PAMC26510_29755 [Caballeronia sordidicola]
MNYREFEHLDIAFDSDRNHLMVMMLKTLGQANSAVESMTKSFVNVV